MRYYSSTSAFIEKHKIILITLILKGAFFKLCKCKCSRKKVQKKKEKNPNNNAREEIQNILSVLITNTMGSITCLPYKDNKSQGDI